MNPFRNPMKTIGQWGMANEPVYNMQATAYLYRDEPEAAHY
jgi:hypothetical protein